MGLNKYSYNLRKKFEDKKSYFKSKGKRKLTWFERK